MQTNRIHAADSGRRLALSALVAAAVLASAPRAHAVEPPEPESQTFLISGQELTGVTTAPAGDGSVRTVVQAGVLGLLYNVEEHATVPARALVAMSITVDEDVLLGAEVRYTQFGPHGFTVTVEIDPCWFEYVNDRDATADEFGADVVARIEAVSPQGTLDHIGKSWLAQRLSLLGARTAEPYVKHGVVLVPPHS